MYRSDAVIRIEDLTALHRGLKDALQVLKNTPLYEGADELYQKALDEAEKLDNQLAMDQEVLLAMHEKGGRAQRLEKLKEQYEKECAKSNAVGRSSAAIAKLRSRRPKPVEAESTSLQPSTSGEEEMAVVEVVRSHRDPLGGGLIKDPVKSKDCGHVYDRATLQQYIRENQERRNAFYQCPYSLCRNKKNMCMDDMIDCPEFLAS